MKVPFTFNDNFGDYLYINVGISSRRTNDSSSVQYGCFGGFLGFFFIFKLKELMSLLNINKSTNYRNLKPQNSPFF